MVSGNKGDGIFVFQQHGQVFQPVVPQGVGAHPGEHAVFPQGIVIFLLHHVAVKSLYGSAVHRKLRLVRVQSHAHEQLGDRKLVPGGKIETPALRIDGVGTAVVAAHHKTYAVAVPVGVPIDVDLRAPFVLRHLSLRVAFIIPIFRRIHGGKLIIDRFSIRAVAHKLRHMDGQLLCAAPFVPDGFFQRELLRDTFLLGCKRRGILAAAGALAGGSGAGAAFCAAAPGQHQRGSQHQRGKAFVFHGRSPCFLSRSCRSFAAGSPPRQRGFARRSWSGSGRWTGGPS